MVVSTNLYGLKEKDSSLLIKILIAGLVLEFGCLGFHLVNDHAKSKEGKAAFEQESAAQLVKVKHMSSRHGDSGYVYFDVDGNERDYEYYGRVGKLDKMQEGQKASGADFMKANPNMIIYKTGGRL